MLIGHTLRYLPAQLLSPLAQLASMLLWTHWLEPAEMGVFTLVTVAQEMAFMVCLGWFSVYALRYLPPSSDVAGRLRYLGTENGVVLASIGISFVGAAITVLALPKGHITGDAVLLIAAFFATKAFNVHYAERARAQSAFVSYTLLQTAGPVGGLVLGWLAMRWLGATPEVLLAAYAVAQGVGTLLALPGLGMSWRLPRPDTQLLRTAFAFGGPVLMLTMLGWVAENYIRYLVQWQAGAQALGLMVVGWALGRRCASVASMLVTTAAFPLAARLLNEGRRAEALAQLRSNASLMIAVLLPVTAAMFFLGPALVALTVAEDYRQITTELLAWAALGGALRNLHVHVSDQLMVLDRKVAMLARLDIVEIVLCAGASLAGLLMAGLHGALWGQALGSLLALGLSIHWAQRHLGLLWPWGDSLRVLMSVGLMSAVLWWLQAEPTLRGLALGSGVGAGAYVLAMALAFAPQARGLLRKGRTAMAR